jgi:hypothetical protein
VIYDSMVPSGETNEEEPVEQRIDVTNEDCSSCGAKPGRHCRTWCELNGTSWDEIE